MSRHGRRLLFALFLFGSPFAQARDTAAPSQTGIEVQARGPIHEAYASPTTEPTPTKPVPTKPPQPIEEIPPEEKPEGDVVWISGYWAWDDDRSDFLWVSGIWRVVPPGRRWVAGYWRADAGQWQWVPGFWTVSRDDAPSQDVTYLPAPPVAPEVAPPAKPPSEDSFYVPGAWIWTGDRYVFRAGYWARAQPGYVWVPDHYRWTPSGYVYVPGYWDLALRNRGILYAPVVISPAVRTVGFVYTPAYAVRDTVVVEALFVRPTACHYYFGDYYSPTYRNLGFESCVVYSRRRYDPIVVYEVYERRDPLWIGLQINLFNDRAAGRAPRPPRTLVQQNNTVVNNTTIVNNNTTIVNNNTLIAPTRQVAVNKNTNLVKLDENTRRRARAQAAEVEQVSRQRSDTEVALKPGSPRAARTASLAVPRTEPIQPVNGETTPRTPFNNGNANVPPAGRAAARRNVPPPGETTTTGEQPPRGPRAATANPDRLPPNRAGRPSAQANVPPNQEQGEGTSPVANNPRRPRPATANQPPEQPGANLQPSGRPGINPRPGGRAGGTPLPGRQGANPQPGRSGANPLPSRPGMNPQPGRPGANPLPSRPGMNPQPGRPGVPGRGGAGLPDAGQGRSKAGPGPTRRPPPKEEKEKPKGR